MWCAQCFLHSNCWGCGLSRSGLRKSIGHNCCYWWWWWWWWVVGCGLWVVGCGTSRGARAGSCRAPARILSASASNPVFQHDVFQFLWPKWWHWLSQRNVSCKSSMTFYDRSDDIDSVCAMFCANPACWIDTMFCGVPIVFCIWRVQCTVFMTKVMTSTQCSQCFVQIQHVEVAPGFVVYPLCVCIWHVQCTVLVTKMLTLTQHANVSCKSRMLKWHHVLWCAHCVLHLICTFFMTKVMTSTQCAQCFVQIQHVEVTPGFVVCALCFAFDMYSVQF